jgi:hypothetical protein
MPADPPSYDDALAQFEAYAEYIGRDSVDDLHPDGLEIAFCAGCDLSIPISVSDPQGYGPVLCPECGEVTEFYPLRKLME